MRSLFRTFFIGLICLLLIASSDVTVNVHGYRSGRSSATAQSGGVVTINPTANQTPSPSYAGAPEGGITNTGHPSVESQIGLSGNGDNRIFRTGEWSSFPGVTGAITAINLKAEWSYEMDLSYSVSGGSPGFGGAYGLVGIDYSTNNGGSWASAMGFLFDQSNADGSLSPSDSGSINISLPANTPISQIRVRDLIEAEVAISGDDGDSSGNSQVLLTISNIRLEVATVNCFATVPGDRWRGEYYNNTGLSGSPVIVRDDGAGFLNLNFGGGGPGSTCAVASDNFSARWTRTVNFAAGTYRFTASVDNGVKLYVDGQVKIDQWGNLPPNTYTADVSLSAGPHEIKLEFVEYTGGASVSLFWGVVNCLANVPMDRWRGEYFNGMTPTDFPLMVRDDGVGFLNFNFGDGGPGGNCGLGVDNFSARWTRTVNFAPGIYRFSVTGDDGVRLYVDGQLKIDKWFTQGPTTYTTDVTFNSAGPRQVKLEYFESSGPAIALVSWADPTGVNCLPTAPLPLISSVPLISGKENIASTSPSQAPKRCGQKNSD
jgi:hypothetical protein